jgi:hypothetical protein
VESIEQLRFRIDEFDLGDAPALRFQGDRGELNQPFDYIILFVGSLHGFVIVLSVRKDAVDAEGELRSSECRCPERVRGATMNHQASQDPGFRAANLLNCYCLTDSFTATAASWRCSDFRPLRSCKALGSFIFATQPRDHKGL